MPPATNIITTPDAVLERGLRTEFDRIKPNADYQVDSGTRGIIYVGGGKYWPGIMVGIRLLRQWSDIPIEIWYREDVEEVFPEDIFGIPGVTLRPISEKLGGWEAKLHALYNTWFEQVLYLDADAYCIADPVSLFNLLSEENPFMYWKDLPSQANSIKWKAVYPEGATVGVPAVQGGQILIDRGYAWRTIHTSKYMCDNSTFYFKRMYGDQDTWRVALSARTSNYLCLGDAAWDRIAFRCSHMDTLYVVHRCKGKLFTPEHIPAGNRLYANPHYDYPLEVEVFSLFAEYVNRREPKPGEVFEQVYKRQLWGMQPSGGGSTMKEATPYIDYVNHLIQSNGFKSVVDAGCGDGRVSGMIKCGQYTGYDCAASMVERNKKLLSNRSFIHLDISLDYGIMNAGDVLLCKDVLHHWPNDTIIRFLEYLTTCNKWKMIVLCFDIQQKQDNQECHLGGYRALDAAMNPLKRFDFKYAAKFLHKGIVVLDNTIFAADSIAQI